MRLAPIAPADLTAEQKPLHDDMRNGVAKKYDLFQTVRADGALLGPWSAWLHQPEVGTAIWGTTKAMTAFAIIPDGPRQVAILAVGARFKAAYEIYAHSAVAGRKLGMSEARLATLAAGQRPVDLSQEEGAAYDMAVALLSGGVLPEPIYRHALALFGQKGVNELTYLVGHYCLVSITLNAFAIPVPEGD